MNRRPVKPTLASGIPGVNEPPTSDAPQPSRPAMTLQRAAPSIADSATPVQPCRPIQRPPMAILELLDDGSDQGEEFRVRADMVTIGRTNADILIPHDTQISGCHVRLSRRPIAGEFHWFLTDLSSTNGTFLRVAKAMLQPATPFVVGSHRYRYRPAADATVEAPASGPVATKGWKAPSAEDLQRQFAAIIRIVPDGDEHVFPFQSSDVAIGSDPAVTNITITDDPTVNGLHANVRTTDRGRTIEDNKSLNGLWIAITERRLSSTSTFQIGEQRIRFRVL